MKFSVKLSSDLKANFDKDILKVGTWQNASWDQPWVISPKTLDQIVTEFNQYISLGNEVPIVYNHSHDVRDNVGKVLSLYVEGEDLRMKCAILDSLALDKITDKTINNVSIEIGPCQDSLGNSYELLLSHVGLVNHPVIVGQGEWMALSRQLDLGNTMDLTQLVSDLLVALGSELVLPEGTTDETLKDALTALVAEASKEESSEAPEEAKAEEVSELPLSQKDLALIPDGIRKQLSVAFVAANKQLANGFETRLNNLIATGKVSPKHKPRLLSIGKAMGFEQNTLEPFEDLPEGAAISLKSKTKSLAKTTEPEVSEGKGVDKNNAIALASKHFSIKGTK